AARRRPHDRHRHGCGDGPRRRRAADLVPRRVRHDQPSDLSMSEQNVELVRRALESFNERGELPLDAIDPEVEWVTLMETHHGHRGVREWAANVTENLDELAI